MLLQVNKFAMVAVGIGALVMASYTYDKQGLTQVQEPLEHSRRSTTDAEVRQTGDGASDRDTVYRDTTLVGLEEKLWCLAVLCKRVKIPRALI